MFTTRITHRITRYYAALPMAIGFLGGARGAFAQINTCNNLLLTLTRIANFGGGVLLAIGIIVFLVAAFYLLFGGGSEDAAKKGRQYLTFGVAGIVVGMLAFSLPYLISGVVGTPIPSCPS